MGKGFIIVPVSKKKDRGRNPKFPLIFMVFLIASAMLLLVGFNSCKLSNPSGSNSIAADSATIASGEASFIQKCSGCHNFKMDGIGPQLGGITTQVSVDWLQHFIHNPKNAIDSGDQRAKTLFEKFHSVMPSFASSTDEELNAIIAFLNTHQEPGRPESKFDGASLRNPVSQKIGLSTIVAGLEPVAQIPASSDGGKKPLARITKMDHQPGKTGLFVLDLRGKLYSLGPKGPVIYMDMGKLEPKFIHQPGLATGFGSFAFHPDFFHTGLLYTTHTEPAHSDKADFTFEDFIKPALQWVLTEWKTDQPNTNTFSGKGRELMRVDMVSGIHGVQEIIFNPLSRPGDEDYGLLYIGVGDGGCVENGYPWLAHSVEKIWGTVLRIDPQGRNSSNGKYGIPAQNPFVKGNSKNILKEIYAYGFRNPHRITWIHSGQMLVSNIGHSNIESINLIQPGHDYGWPIREGNFLLNPYGDLTKVHPLPPDDSNYHITYPVAEYDHDEGKAISGGYEYLGNDVPALKEKFLFGDIPSGRLFYIDLADLKQGKQAAIREWKVSIKGEQKSLVELCGDERVDLHFGRDARGELYLMTKADGKIYRVISATN